MQFKVLSILSLFPVIFSCSVQGNEPEQAQIISSPVSQVSVSRTLSSQTLSSPMSQQNYTQTSDFIQSMERIAEIERSGAFFQGLALFESSLREEAGDYSGAVIAAYKELSWLYGHGNTSKADITEGMRRILSDDPVMGALVNNTVLAVLAFVDGAWSQAAQLLEEHALQYDEPDSFYQWMLLVCSLESGKADDAADYASGQAIRGAYGAIRARYSEFPEYWYRGSMTFNTELAAVYAEQCINLSTDGPFSMECRNILSNFLGLEDSGGAIRTMWEIERYVQISVSENNPEVLSGLFPLLNLPDNKYTHYALGALQSLSALPIFRNYFMDQAVQHTGRLAERLAYIARG